MLAAAAYAAPQESVTFTAVNSNGGFNNAVNDVRTNVFTGGYGVKSIKINAAFQTLKDPVARARYLLGLQGVDTDQETDTSMSPAFLMEQMELREALAEAVLRADRDIQIASLRQQVDKQLELKSATLRVHFAENSEVALGQARNLVREMLFLQKLAHEIQELD